MECNFKRGREEWIMGASKLKDECTQLKARQSTLVISGGLGRSAWNSRPTWIEKEHRLFKRSGLMVNNITSALIKTHGEEYGQVNRDVINRMKTTRCLSSTGLSEHSWTSLMSYFSWSVINWKRQLQGGLLQFTAVYSSSCGGAWSNCSLKPPKTQTLMNACAQLTSSSCSPGSETRRWFLPTRKWDLLTYSSPLKFITDLLSHTVRSAIGRELCPLNKPQ